VAGPGDGGCAAAAALHDGAQPALRLWGRLLPPPPGLRRARRLRPRRAQRVCLVVPPLPHWQIPSTAAFPAAPPARCRLARWARSALDESMLLGQMSRQCVAFNTSNCRAAMVRAPCQCPASSGPPLPPHSFREPDVSQHVPPGETAPQPRKHLGIRPHCLRLHANTSVAASYLAAVMNRKIGPCRDTLGAYRACKSVPSSSPNYKDMSGLHRWKVMQEVEAHVVEELLGAAIEIHSIV